MRTIFANALYFPYIQPPKNAWFTRVMLYWDRVGSIVPYEYIEDPDNLDDYMLSLLEADLLEQIVPGFYLEDHGSFEKSFLQFIDIRYASNQQTFCSDWARTHPGAKDGLRIHMEKLQSLGEELCRRGLAKFEAEPWFMVEPQIASDFMAYLAGVLGQMHHLKFSPVTESPEHLRPFSPEAAPHGIKSTVRDLLLEGILPCPKGELEPMEIAKFKMKHEEPLRRFRRTVEDRVSELATITDHEQLRARLDVSKTILRETIDELAARMAEQRNWPRIDFCTFCAVTAFGLDVWKAASDQDWTFGLTSATVSLAPAIQAALPGSHAQFEDQPLAYAAFLKRL